MTATRHADGDDHLSALLQGAKSAFQTLRYLERELTDLNAVLPELQPANRCLVAVQSAIEKLAGVLPESEPMPNLPQKTFIDSIDQAIAFHQTNANDPHGIGNAVIAALVEIRRASVAAYKVSECQ